MKRDELDAFFAKAEDVLTDWPGSVDAMSTAPVEVSPLAAVYHVEIRTETGWVDLGTAEIGTYMAEVREWLLVGAYRPDLLP